MQRHGAERFTHATSRLLRRVVPSTVLLTQSSYTATPLDVLDKLCCLPFREFRRLPPNRFRVRVGVGNRLLFNQAHFLMYGAQTCLDLFAEGHARPTSDILEIGSGCGRFAYALKHVGAYAGTYNGVDVDEEMVQWCQANLEDGRTRFHFADVYNSLYNPGGISEPYVFPVDDRSQDLVIGQSVFTHLLEDDLMHYVDEAFRVLRPDGRMLMSVFCVDDVDAGGRWTFRHRRGNAYLENASYPEAAVAYERDYLVGVGARAGFAESEVRPDGPQSVWVVTKADSRGEDLDARAASPAA